MAENKTTAATQEKPKAFPTVKFAIEICNHRNQQVIWNPDAKVMRGRWENTNIPAGNNVDATLRAMPEIPGIVIMVDSSKRALRRYDPLRLPKHKDLLERIRTVYSSMFDTLDLGAKVSPDNDIFIKVDDASEDELRTWTYWARRILDSDNCRVIDGEVPQMGDILNNNKFPGLVAKNNHEPAIMEKYTDPNMYFKQKLRYTKQTPEVKPTEFQTDDVLDESEVLV